MLSPLERGRLTDREGQNSKDKATNDMRVRRKLAAWLDDMRDATLILKCLPNDQLVGLIRDWNIYLLLAIVDDAIKIKKFYPIEGEPDKFEEWKAVIEYEKRTGEKTVRPAEDIDITRGLMLVHLIKNLKQHVGPNSPLPKVDALAEACRISDFGARLTDGEKQAIEKTSNALKKYMDEAIPKEPLS